MLLYTDIDSEIYDVQVFVLQTRSSNIKILCDYIITNYQTNNS